MGRYRRAFRMRLPYHVGVRSRPSARRSKGNGGRRSCESDDRIGGGGHSAESASLRGVILRDPVHGLVAFEGEDGALVEALLDTREVQRLRRVQQLGLTSLVFPGAEHSRFAHALGAAHVMVRVQERIRQLQGCLPPEERMDDEAARDALAAALLHDLGHGPLSHLFEDVLPVASHEEWTATILSSPETEIHRRLEAISQGMAARVVALLSGTHPIGYLSRAISGTLDVDRADYLLRDSHMTGASYGLYDLDWIVQSLCFAKTEGPSATTVLAVEGRKGLPPVEGFFLGRNFMYQQVYHHKATRAAEVLVRAIFQRLAELVRDGSSPPSMPRPLRAAALGEPMSVDEYLALDDAQLHVCFAQWVESGDPILTGLTSRLRARRLPKTLPLPAGAPAQWAMAEELARDIVAKRGLRSDLMVAVDVPSDIPYCEPDEPSPESVWVSIRHRPLQQLGDVSFLLRELRNKRIERPRLVFPAEVRGEVERAVEGALS